jgi:hypothetical protein
VYRYAIHAAMKLSIAEVERRFSARANYLTVSFTVRNTFLRKAGHLPLGARGPNAPGATEQNFGVMMLGLVAAVQAKDIVAGYERVRAFKLDRVFLEKEDGARERIEVEKLALAPGDPLERVLLGYFKPCALNPELLHLLELRVDHSAVAPKAYVSVRETVAKNTPVIHRLEFWGPPAPSPPQTRDAVETSLRLCEHALMAMVDLFSLTIQLPPANETGPSAQTDEPVSMIPDNLIDRHRAPTRKRQKRA